MKGDLGWLQSVNCIIAELHPEIADVTKVIAAIENQGFKFLPATEDDTRSKNRKMDVFVKNEILGKFSTSC